VLLVLDSVDTPRRVVVVFIVVVVVFVVVFVVV
jgi:hypothetical protein